LKDNNFKKKQHFINLRKLTKPAAFCISALFIISILLAFSSTAVQAATADSQVAVSSATASSYDGSHTPNIAINGDESTWDYWGTNAMTSTGKLPQWLQLDLGTQTSINQITTHFYDGDSRTYTYYIQTSTDGSNWNTIVPTKTGSSIVTDTFTQTTARYLKITITGNTANLAAHIIEIKIYRSTTQTSTPTNTPPPTTTQSTFTSSANLEPLSAFYADMNGAASSYASLDYGTLHNGNPSIRTGADYVRGTREVDGAWIGVKPGDHIVMSAWIKTAPYTTSVLFSGAEIGCDFYISSSQGHGIATIDSAGHQAGHPNEAEIANDYCSSTGGITYVNWGSDWTLITWDFYVPTNYYNYVTRSSILSINPQQIDSMVMWFGGRNIQANAYCWLADPALFVNP